MKLQIARSGNLYNGSVPRDATFILIKKKYAEILIKRFYKEF